MLARETAYIYALATELPRLIRRDAPVSYYSERRAYRLY